MDDRLCVLYIAIDRSRNLPQSQRYAPRASCGSPAVAGQAEGLKGAPSTNLELSGRRQLTTIGKQRLLKQILFYRDSYHAFVRHPHMRALLSWMGPSGVRPEHYQDNRLILNNIHPHKTSCCNHCSTRLCGKRISIYIFRVILNLVPSRQPA